MFAASSEIHWGGHEGVAGAPKVALEFQVEATNSAPIPSAQGMVPGYPQAHYPSGAQPLTLNAQGEISEERRYFDTGSLVASAGSDRR